MSRWTTKQTSFMKEALRLARQGWGLVSPNPMVGAVLVKRGRIIASSWHTGPGQPHAEAAALAEAGRKAAGSDLYVNLEPCSHHGRTGPCTQAIIEAGVKKVFYSVSDPNATAAGGAAILSQAGVEVDEGLLADEAWELNQFFFKWVTTGRPFVILKTAATLDGRIATYTGQSRWITSKAARNFGHNIRAGVDAIMIGRTTASKDNPELSARPWGRRKMHRQPWRIVLDPSLKLPQNLKLFDPQWGGPTVVVCAPDSSSSSQESLRCLGHKVWVVNRTETGLLSLPELMEKIGQSGLQSVLMEPGATLAASALLEEPVVDLIHIFLAPKLIGGSQAPGMLGGAGLSSLDLARPVEILKVGRKGPDIHLMLRPVGAFSSTHFQPLDEDIDD